MERPKRIVNKPQRYQTTSSDESSQQRIITATRVENNGNIDDDVRDIKKILQNNNIQQCNDITDCDYAFTNDYVPTRIYTEPYTYTSTHSNMQSCTDGTYACISPNTFTYSSQPALPSYILEENGTNKVHAKLQSKTMMCNVQKEQHRESYPPQHMQHLKKMDNGKIYALLLKIMKCVQNSHSVSTKPACFPLKSIDDLNKFEEIDDDQYSNVVTYFCNIGGFNMKEAVNLYLKESIVDTLTLSYTWWGRNEQQPFYNKRLVMAIYDATCKNRYFEKPTRSEFQQCMKEALRAAKERVRSRSRGPRTPAARKNVRRNFWNEEEEEEEEQEEQEEITK